MRISAIGFTQKGVAQAKKLAAILPNTTAYGVKSAAGNTGVIPVQVPVGAWAKEHFNRGEALIFVGAVGIAVRAIAPFVQSKTTDPAVIVIDEKGEYVIPLLSGHIGGANQLARKIAEQIGAAPVITTATDMNDVFAVDTWAKKAGYYIVNPQEIKNISGDLLKGKQVALVSELPVTGTLPPGVVENGNSESGIVISDNPVPIFQNTLLLQPKRYILGVGCRKNIDSLFFEEAILNSLVKHKIDIHTVQTIASIDIKKNETAILNFAEKYNLEFVTFTAAQLQEAPGVFSQSKFVRDTVGVDNVCERACSLLAENILVKKQLLGGVTLAVSGRDWTVAF